MIKRKPQKLHEKILHHHLNASKTRPDTRLPQSRVAGQGPYFRSLHHLGRSSEAKDRKKPKKVKYDGRTDRRTDGPTKRGVGSRSTRLKSYSRGKIIFITFPS